MAPYLQGKDNGCQLQIMRESTLDGMKLFNGDPSPTLSTLLPILYIHTPPILLLLGWLAWSLKCHPQCMSNECLTSALAHSYELRIIALWHTNSLIWGFERFQLNIKLSSVYFLWFCRCLPYPRHDNPSSSNFCYPVLEDRRKVGLMKMMPGGNDSYLFLVSKSRWFTWESRWITSWKKNNKSRFFRLTLLKYVRYGRPTHVIEYTVVDTCKVNSPAKFSLGRGFVLMYFMSGGYCPASLDPCLKPIPLDVERDDCKLKLDVGDFDLKSGGLDLSLIHQSNAALKGSIAVPPVELLSKRGLGIIKEALFFLMAESCLVPALRVNADHRIWSNPDFKKLVSDFIPSVTNGIVTCFYVTFVVLLPATLSVMLVAANFHGGWSFMADASAFRHSSRVMHSGRNTPPYRTIFSGLT